jgi:hypothetical protein
MELRRFHNNLICPIIKNKFIAQKYIHAPTNAHACIHRSLISSDFRRLQMQQCSRNSRNKCARLLLRIALSKKSLMISSRNLGFAFAHTDARAQTHIRSCARDYGFFLPFITSSAVCFLCLCPDHQAYTNVANRQMKSRQGDSLKVKPDAISDTSSSPGGGGGGGIRARGMGGSGGGVGGIVHRHYTADVSAPPRQKDGSRSSRSTSKSPPGLLRARLQINLLPRRERSSSSSAGERSSGSSAGDSRRRNRDRPSLARKKGHEDGELKTNAQAEKREGEVNSHSREASSISSPNQAISGAKPNSIGEGSAGGARGGGGGGAPRRFRQGRSSSAAGYRDDQGVGMEERLSEKQRSILEKMELSVRSRHFH